MCHRFETTIQILQIFEKDQIKSHGMERNESNQIKSNQSQEKTTQHGFDFYENLMKSFPFYLSIILYFDFD